MKLLGRLRELELGRAEAERPVIPMAIVWTHAESRLDDDIEVRAGQRLVVDVVETPATAEAPRQWRTRERLASTAGDLGIIYAPSGEVLGLVVSRKGSLVVVDYFAAGSGRAARRSRRR
jgi:hypothetical protein